MPAMAPVLSVIKDFILVKIILVRNRGANQIPIFVSRCEDLNCVVYVLCPLVWQWSKEALFSECAFSGLDCTVK